MWPVIDLVTAIIKPHKLDDVKEALQAIDLVGLTVTEVRGFGRQGGKSETFRGAEYKIDYVPKVKIEAVVDSADTDQVVETISRAAATGKIGDGKVWAHGLDRVRRIRTGEEGTDAL